MRLTLLLKRGVISTTKGHLDRLAFNANGNSITILKRKLAFRMTHKDGMTETVAVSATSNEKKSGAFLADGKATGQSHYHPKSQYLFNRNTKPDTIKGLMPP